MKIYFLFAAILISISVSAQNAIVYKRNVLTGKLEVYNAQNGIPVGQPLYEISRNIYGYTEIKALSNNQGVAPNYFVDPYSRKPDYSVQNFQPYQAPYGAMVDAVNARNSQFYENLRYTTNSNLYTPPPAKNSAQLSVDEIRRSLMETFDLDNKKALSLVTFYNSIQNYPTTIKDGWHFATSIDKIPSEAVATLAADISLNINVSGYYQTVKYLVYVEKNIMKSIFWLMPEESRPIDIGKEWELSSFPLINNASCYFNSKGSSAYTRLYFFDEIIDPNYVAPVKVGFLEISYPGISMSLSYISENLSMFSYPADEPSYGLNLGIAGVPYTFMVFGKGGSQRQRFIIFKPNKTYQMRLFDKDGRFWDWKNVYVPENQTVSTTLGN